MERTVPRNVFRSSGLSGAVKSLIRDWAFPFILALAWMAATTYTLLLVSRRAPPARPEATIATPPQPAAVVDAQVSQQSRRGS